MEMLTVNYSGLQCTYSTLQYGLQYSDDLAEESVVSRFIYSCYSLVTSCTDFLCFGHEPQIHWFSCYYSFLRFYFYFYALLAKIVYLSNNFALNQINFFSPVSFDHQS